MVLRVLPTTYSEPQQILKGLKQTFQDNQDPEHYYTIIILVWRFDEESELICAWAAREQFNITWIYR